MSRYSVYNKKTGMPVYIYGTAEKCAAAMGLAVSSFHSLLSRQRKGQVHRTWEIFPDKEEDLNEEEAKS